MPTDISAEDARKLLDYNPETGVLTWKVSRRGVVVPGLEAGTVKTFPTGKTYRLVKLHRRQYRAHRVIFLLMTGKFPDGEVDHENGNGLDNRWCNLRDATRTQNQQNTRRGVRNTSGFVGVGFDKKRQKWRVFANLNGKEHGGRYNSYEEAVAARLRLNERLGFHENHGQERPL